MCTGLKDFEQSFTKYLCVAVAWDDTVLVTEGRETRHAGKAWRNRVAGCGCAWVLSPKHMPWLCASREGALEGGMSFHNYSKGIGSLRKVQLTGGAREGNRPL